MNTPAATQTAREFIESYLRKKADLTKLDQKMGNAFRKKFYSGEIVEGFCAGQQRREELNRETLLEMAVDGEVARAIVTKPPAGERKIMIRYHLRKAGERWQIFCTESLCLHCHGSGRLAAAACSRCGGTGWHDYAREWQRDHLSRRQAREQAELGRQRRINRQPAT